MSSGRPTRRTGVPRDRGVDARPSRPFSSEARSIGVSMKPGGMVLTVIPFGPELEGEGLGEPDHRPPWTTRSAP